MTVRPAFGIKRIASVIVSGTSVEEPSRI